MADGMERDAVVAGEVAFGQQACAGAELPGLDAGLDVAGYPHVGQLGTAALCFDVGSFMIHTSTL